MIWGCPECEDTEDGPRTPAKDHPCRLCAACTLRLGRFVHRTFRGPAIKRKKRKRYSRPPVTWEGMDLHAELLRLAEFCPPTVQANPPALVLKRVKKVPRTMGWARFVEREIELVVWPACPLGFALAGLVHELAHFCVPGAKHSDDGFRMTMVELVRDGYRVEPAMPKGRRCAQLDHAIEDALVAWTETLQGLSQ